MMTRLFLILSALLVTCLLSAQDEQGKYLPILDEGIRFYFAEGRGSADGGAPPHTFSYFECKKDVENENIYHAIYEYNYTGNITFEVSEDNSKLWERFRDTKYLLMDLNLDVGDKFRGFTVAKVYQKDGRKHIEFEFNESWYGACICKDENDAVYMQHVPFTFIEGIGPNAFIGEEGDLTWIYARYKNGEFEYGIDGYLPRWVPKTCHPTPPYGVLWCNWGYTCKKEPDLIKETKVGTLLLIPDSSGEKVQVKLPENITEKAILTISDLSGRNIETVAVTSNSFLLDTSHYAPATYIAKISADNCQYVGKIIKK